METPFNQILNQLQPAVTTIIIEDLPTQDNLYQKLQEHNSFAAPWIAFASVFSIILSDIALNHAWVQNTKETKQVCLTHQTCYIYSAIRLGSVSKAKIDFSGSAINFLFVV
ncbi:hypothetical protein OWV82_004365 [Melia azedarach]|uniref:Uncharacterized protein n=1 Tax=Melia azedarach TaxID=155640 RepID=A0ACC1YQQ1_MELAZ|nr:hypothetical protein OWV82_004365 [Melia azedarach]